MKNSLLFLVLFIAIFSACKKEEKIEYIISENDFIPLFFKSDELLATATKEIEGLGEREWAFNTFTLSLSGSLSLFLWTFEDSLNCYQREGLKFKQLPIKKGRYTLSGNSPYAVYERMLSDGDVLEASWHTVENSPSYIEISEIDENKRTLSGTFEVFLLRADSFETTQVYSDKINFRNGIFEAKY